MTASRGLRVAVAGATGALGGEVLEVLGERDFPVRELVAFAGEDSEAGGADFLGDPVEIAADAAALRGADVLFLCAPHAPSLDLVRTALRESVPCFDLSGALAGSGDVPLLAADLGPDPAALRSPVVAAPAGPALAWSLVLAPLAREVGLVRVIGTGLEGASAGGRRGIESLSAETIALFNQQELPEPTVFPQPVAFDCLPGLGDVDERGITRHERDVSRDLHRLLGDSLRIAVTTVRVPIFTGAAASLAIETGRELAPEAAVALLAKAPGLEAWADELPGPPTRAAAGRDCVLFGRVRRDPSAERGLLLWLAADALRLAAVNGVRLAEARFRAE